MGRVLGQGHCIELNGLRHYLRREWGPMRDLTMEFRKIDLDETMDEYEKNAARADKAIEFYRSAIIRVEGITDTEGNSVAWDPKLIDTEIHPKEIVDVVVDLLGGAQGNLPPA